MPLPSSFSKDKIFVPPKSSRDVLKEKAAIQKFSN
jgi:hypothetical protein